MQESFLNCKKKKKINLKKIKITNKHYVIAHTNENAKSTHKKNMEKHGQKTHTQNKNLQNVLCLFVLFHANTNIDSWNNWDDEV